MHFLCKKKRSGALGNNHPASKATWRLHLTDVALLLWQLLLLPDLVTAWDKGIYRPPSCLWTISVSVASWTMMGYKQIKQTENLGKFGFGQLLSNSHRLCWMWRHLRSLTAFTVFEENLPHSRSDGPTGYTHRWATTNPNIPLLRRINPNGSNWVLGLEALFLPVKKIWVSVLVVVRKISLF